MPVDSFSQHIDSMVALFSASAYAPSTRKAHSAQIKCYTNFCNRINVQPIPITPDTIVRVDKDRVKTVGPDRACAEWLLRCGAGVRWKGLNHWEKNYNGLPAGNFEKYKIEEIDASESAVMGIGFPHLEEETIRFFKAILSKEELTENEQGLKHVRKFILHNCNYLDDVAIGYLPLVKDTLEELEISSCGDITERSIPPLKELQKLQNLVMFNLPEIKDSKSVLTELAEALPRCEIDFKDAIPKKEE